MAAGRVVPPYGSFRHHSPADGPDVEHVALTLAQQGFHAGLEPGQPFLGHEGLDGARKAASVNPDGPGALQQLRPQGQGQGDGLLARVMDCLLYTSDAADER